MSPALLLFNVLVAIAATALAALYPIRRATQVQPALQIKIN
jgi:ABC-type antimicrobial peptide transport system permease subunit